MAQLSSNRHNCGYDYFFIGVLLLCSHAATSLAITTSEEAWLTSEIESVIEANGNLIPKFVRLSFHDCVDGCNGCVNMDNLDNAGLEVPISSLESIFTKAEAPAGLSRADLWALAGLVGARRAARNAGNDDLEFKFRWGRTDCADPNNTDEELPNNLSDGTTEIYDFFDEKFGFDQYETVVLLGAHTLGGASASNSGFQGTWTDNPLRLDNEYYSELARPWRQVSVSVRGAQCDRLDLRPDCELLQWRRGRGGGRGGGGGRGLLQRGGGGRPGGGGGGGNRFDGNFMLNVDIAMTRDIDPAADGSVRGRFNRLPDAPTDDTVERFARRRRNEEWQEEFEAVFVRMVEACILMDTPCNLQNVQ